MPDVNRPTCSTHQAFIVGRALGTGTPVTIGEVTGLFEVVWNRLRDDISNANVKFMVQDCCDLASQLSTVRHELHIFRDEEPVWEGPITRLEFEYDYVEIFAADVLWYAKKRVLERGYNYHFGTGPGAIGPQSVINHASWLLSDQCFSRYGDQFDVDSRLHPISGPEDPVISKAVNAWSTTVWEDLDALAQYFGMDYTVVNREVYWFDTHLDWNPIDALDEGWLSKFPRIVEYGEDYANRYVRTDGSGFAGVADGPPAQVELFKPYIDLLANDVDQTDPQNANQFIPAPTPAMIAEWNVSAAKRVKDLSPPRTAVLIPGGTSLLPSCTWDINTLMPGSWFPVDITRQCRQLDEFQKLNELKVTEVGGSSETVAIAAASAPSERLVPGA